MCNFELIWPCLVIPNQSRLICDSFTKNYLHNSTNSRDIGISGILYNLIGQEHFGQ